MSDELDSITNNAKLEDGSAELEDGSDEAFSFATIDTSLLTSPAVLRSIAGVTIGLSVLAWPDRSDRVLSRLIGLSLAWLAVASIRRWSHQRPMQWLSAAGAVLTLLAGVALVLNPDQSTVFLGRVVGAALIGHALLSVVRMRRTSAWEWARLSWFGLVAAVGLVLFVATDSTLGALIALGAVGVVGVSLLTLVISLDARTEGTATYADTVDLVSGWLRDRPKSVDARHSLYAKILYEGETAPTRVIRFFALMGFAAVIASMGIITDSTAVVIGAMLVAPLMTPLMGMAISLVMGWPNRLARSSLLALGGILFAIGIGVLLGLVAPAVIDTATNTQILARRSPTVLDLITATAAGAAGAYGLSRPDVSDSLPGVAIAISLVPPLTVVGIAYSQGDWASGNGALLLFATNMIAILIVGGITFVFTGVTPLQRATDNQYRVRTAVFTTCTGAVLVFGALLLNGAQITADTFDQSAVESTIDDWLPDDGLHRLVSADLDDGTVNAVIVGPSEGLPDVSIVADVLADKLDQSITVNVSLIVEERLTASGG